MKIYPKFTNEELAALSLGGELPHHVGIIMDGNGRWAKKRLLPRSAGRFVLSTASSMRERSPGLNAESSPRVRIRTPFRFSSSIS